MHGLTASAEQAVQSLAQRYGVSVDAVLALLSAVSAGGGTMAQFYHPELGGGGQWMQGGMTMVGDMFNGRLQSTVSGLCSELSTLLREQQVFVPSPAHSSLQQPGGMHSSSSWWPAELGQPSSSGGQNDVRYAYFPGPRRLAVQRGGQLTVYDTLDHQIGGVQQQQGGAYGSQTFSSQYGTFTVESLPLAQPSQQPSLPAPPPPAATQYAEPAQPPYGATPPASAASFTSSPSEPGPRSSSEILEAIERLGQLHQRGVLSDDEFRSKKAQLLARL